MKPEFMMAIVALATVSCPGTVSGSPLENRYVNAGNRANRATDSHRQNTSGAARKSYNNGEELERGKRAYAPWNGEHSEYQTYTTFSVWKPPVYQLNRPYYIPVYGAPGSMPIYFAPQPFEYGWPHHKPPFVGPGYLPPNPPVTTEQPPETTMKVKSRFDFDDDDDDRPRWVEKENENVPTRPPPPPPGFPEFPPLVHDVGALPLSAQDEELINEVFNKPSTFRTQSPPPQRERPTTQRPQSQARTTPGPPSSTPSGPSNCVWAVVSCCSASTSVYPEKCFEQRGCPGPFWGGSPCDTEFSKAAVEAALKYYSNK